MIAGFQTHQHDLRNKLPNRQEWQYDCLEAEHRDKVNKSDAGVEATEIDEAEGEDGEKSDEDVDEGEDPKREDCGWAQGGDDVGQWTVLSQVAVISRNPGIGR